MNVLGVEAVLERHATPRRRWWSRSGHGETDVEVHHLRVDGHDLTRGVDPNPQAGASPLRPTPPWPALAVDHLRRLLGVEPPDLGAWTSLLVCPACADPSCGVVAARLEVRDVTVSWEDVSLRWPTERADLVEDVDGWGSLPVASYVFDREQYERVLRDLLPRYEDLT